MFLNEWLQTGIKEIKLKNKKKMKATTITMQIVKNLGNYEAARLEATYTLTEMEADHIEDSFVNARGQLERAFKKAYNKTESERVEKWKRELLERVYKGSIEKIPLTDKKQISRVLKAVRDGRLSTEEVREQFEITDEQRDFFSVNGIEL